jgi:N-acetylglutamate synthase-like GNAT family acetyltransferase
MTDVTYNAITTDFWANLDLIGSQETWKMFGTGGVRRVADADQQHLARVAAHPDQEDRGRGGALRS